MSVNSGQSQEARQGQRSHTGSSLARNGSVTAGLAALAAGVLLSILSSAPALGKPKDDRPTCVAMASDSTATAPNRRAVTSDHKGKVFRWNLDPIGEEHRYKQHQHKASYVSVSLSAQLIFTASYDGMVFVSNLMDAGPNPLPPIVEFDKHIPPTAQQWEIPEVWVVVPSADGQRALSATNDGQILYWALDDGTPAHKPAVLGTFKASDEWVAGLAFMPVAAGNETQFVSTHADGKVCVWDIAGADPHLMPARTFSHLNDRPVNSVAITRSGRFVVSGSHDKTVRIWDLNLPDSQIPIKFDKHTNWVWRVALSPNDDKIASAGEDGKVRLLGLDGLPFKNGANDAVKDETEGVMGVAFVDQNTIVYTVGSSTGDEVKLWSIGGFTHP
jgi:WD40 repeat protein